jgi:uncharacterized protein
MASSEGADSASSVEPLIIDPVRFARDGSRVAGELSLPGMPRLRDLLSDREGAVSYAVQGYMSAKGQPVLRVSLTADLAVPCQRCLEELRLHVDTRREIVLLPRVTDADPSEGEDDDIDFMPSTGSLDLHDLVEQEVVLSLPMAPRHAEAACRLQSGATHAGERFSPFSTLAEWKTEPD